MHIDILLPIFILLCIGIFVFVEKIYVKRGVIIAIHAKIEWYKRQAEFSNWILDHPYLSFDNHEAQLLIQREVGAYAIYIIHDELAFDNKYFDAMLYIMEDIPECFA